MIKLRDPFYRSSPREWRFILIGLTFTGLIAIGFQFAFLATYLQRGGGSMPPYISLVMIVPIASMFLLKDLTASENKHPLGNVQKYLFASVISLATLSTMAWAYFEHAHQSEKDMKADWAISQLCTTDGDIRASNAKICVALLPSFNGRICTLGATPMNACEVKLRKRLDLPDTDTATS